MTRRQSTGEPRPTTPQRHPEWEYAGLFGVSMLLSGLLCLAFPYGITTEETPSYLAAVQGFSWTQSNMSDWHRTPLLGFLYQAAIRLFPNPSLAVYWLHATLFAFSLAVLLFVCRRLFADRRSASLATWSYLGLEVFSMRAFYYDTQIASDALHGRLAMLSAFLIIGGWLGKRMLPIAGGYAIIGWTALMRSASVALFPVWLPFALIACRFDKCSTRVWLGRTALCVAVSIVPMLAWSARNAALYGQFRPTGYSSFQFLSRAIVLLEDDDVLFEDPGENRRFLLTVRAFEQRVNMRGFDQWMPWGRNARHNTYFPWDGKLPADGPFRFFYDGIGETPRSTDENLLKKPHTIFMVDKASMPAALAIIRNHPVAFATMVLQDYALLFNPVHTIVARKAELFTRKDADSYDDDFVLPSFYPPDGKPDPARINESVRTAWWFLTHNRFVLSLRMIVEGHMFLLLHLGALAACGWLLFTKRSSAATKRKRTYALVFLILFASVASQTFLLSLNQPPMYRFSMANAGMTNLLFMLGPLAAAAWAWQAVVEKRLFGARRTDRLLAALGVLIGMYAAVEVAARLF